MVSANPHGFDLAAERAAPGKTGDDRQLQGSDRLAVRHDDDKELVGIRIDGVECLQVRDEIAGIVTGRAKLVVRQYVHDRLDVVAAGFADGVVAHRASITVCE